ncbi:MAG: hypothetical protein ACIARR_02280 [Phycisphaerales bacterium JB059]
MSAVSGIGGATAASPAQQLQGARPPRPPGPPPGFEAALQSSAEGAGLDESEVSELQAAIEAAIEESRASGEGPGGAREAIAGVLESFGIDPEAFESELRSASEAVRASGRDAGRSSLGSTIAPQSLLESLNAGADGSSSEDLASLLERLQGLPSGSLVDIAA